MRTVWVGSLWVGRRRRRCIRRSAAAGTLPAAAAAGPLKTYTH